MLDIIQRKDSICCHDLTKLITYTLTPSVPNASYVINYSSFVQDSALFVIVLFMFGKNRSNIIEIKTVTHTGPGKT